MNEVQRPWYETTMRWGQTNLTEIDPERYDHEHWERQWTRTSVDGIIVNAGGIVAYYPSEHPLHHRSPYLGDRDLFGEIVDRARGLDLTVVARMDCNRAGERFFAEKPHWFCVDAAGVPYRAAGRYISCIHSPYYDEYIPEILAEVIDRYRPDGFADNSWSGLSRDRICHCRYCSASFTQRAGAPLPHAHDWSSPVYREWIAWNYDRRIEIWDRFNEVTRRHGGTHCLWIGMNSAQMESQSANFRDLGRIVQRTPLVFIDHQRRMPETGFQANSHTGKLVHDLMGWRGQAAESMAMYNHYMPSFRTASAPEPEARMWAVSGMAGGILPWWHHIGSAHRDRRQYEIAPPLWSWHQGAQRYLVDRQPVANVGVLWSQHSFDVYGRDDARMVAESPYEGMVQALLRERLTYRPVHTSRLADVLGELDVLILANVGSVSAHDADLISGFVRRGGGLVLTGESGLYDEEGTRREDFVFAELMGATALHRHHGDRRLPETSWEVSPAHTYLELLRPGRSENESHPLLDGFESTDQIPFGGRLECVKVTTGRAVATLVTPYPAYPPETAWQREPATALPAAIVNEPGSGRVVSLPADLDRCFGRGLQPDHARVLGNAVRWAARQRIPVTYEGAGTVDLHLYRQGDRLVLHLVNLSAAGAWRMPMHEDIPIGPLRVLIDAETAGVDWSDQPLQARALVSGLELAKSSTRAGIELELPRLVDHEVVTVEPQ